MGWEPDNDLCCPFCAERTVDVDEGRDDYYLGPMHRCRSCKQGFYLTAADASPPPVYDGPPSEFSNMLREIPLVDFDRQVVSSILLDELGRSSLGGVAKVRIPLRKAE